MKRIVESGFKRIIGFLFVIFLMSMAFSFDVDAAMSVSEAKQRLSAYSSSIKSANDGILYMEHTEWNVSEDEMFRVINDISGYLMGEPVEDYCKIQLKFFYTEKLYGKSFENFSSEIFKIKTKLTVFWSDWSRYNRIDMSATTYSEETGIFSANVTLKLNGDEATSSGNKYNGKLLSIVGEAQKVCSTDMEYVCYYLNWLKENAEYKYYTKYTNDPYYALILGRTVCGGYANAFKDLCNATGIPAIMTINASKNHAWNEVYVDGVWYSADLCDVVKSRKGQYYNRFLFTDPNVSKDYFYFVEGHKQAYIDTFKYKNEINIGTCKVTVSSPLNYTGSPMKPNVTVTRGKTALVMGKHYTLSYSSNILPGTATVTVTAIPGSGYKGLKSASFKIVIPKTRVTYVASAASVRLQWTAVPYASGYYVKKYDSSTKKYVTIKTTTELSFSVKKLASGKFTSFCVVPFVKSGGKIYTAPATKILTLTKPAKVTSLKASNIKDKILKLSWKKVTGAEKYQIYVSTDKKNWKLRKEVTEPYYSFKSLTANRKYYFKVRAVNSSGKGSFSSLITCTTLLSPVEFSLKASKGNVTVSWEKVKGASGYAIYYSTSKDMADAEKILVKDGQAVKKTVKSLERIKIYHFKVRAFKVVDGKRIYGVFSPSKWTLV